MNLSLKNKHALVCGSTQGIGKASALALAHLGASITLVARNSDKLQSVLAELNTTQQQTHNYLVADFSNPTDLKKSEFVYKVMFGIWDRNRNTDFEYKPDSQILIKYRLPEN